MTLRLQEFGHRTTHRTPPETPLTRFYTVVILRVLLVSVPSHMLSHWTTVSCAGLRGGDHQDYHKQQADTEGHRTTGERRGDRGYIVGHLSVRHLSPVFYQVLPPFLCFLVRYPLC